MFWVLPVSQYSLRPFVLLSRIYQHLIDQVTFSQILLIVCPSESTTSNVPICLLFLHLIFKNLCYCIFNNFSCILFINPMYALFQKKSLVIIICRNLLIWYSDAKLCCHWCVYFHYVFYGMYVCSNLFITTHGWKISLPRKVIPKLDFNLPNVIYFNFWWVGFVFFTLGFYLTSYASCGWLCEAIS